jgi:hypothetical protein
MAEHLIGWPSTVSVMELYSAVEVPLLGSIEIVIC